MQSLGLQRNPRKQRINVFEHDRIPVIFSAVSNPEAIGITDAMDFVTGVTDTKTLPSTTTTD
ncbi:hypothetical protein MGH68_13615 [Erysipelothrix sp. D19-032]